MKIMIFKTRVEHLENILNEIENSNLYEYPHIDFILVKEWTYVNTLDKKS